jgi:hypothetical protein
MTEPNLVYCSIVEYEDDDGFPICGLKCRFDDGQKFEAIEVDGEFPNLAEEVMERLNMARQTGCHPGDFPPVPGEGSGTPIPQPREPMFFGTDHILGEILRRLDEMKETLDKIQTIQDKNRI